MSAEGARSDRAPVEHFERLARESEDPWHYAGDYERAKFRRTLEYLPAETGRTLELGCSIGVFTALLAPRCSHLLAVDFSPTALERARARVADQAQVEVECRKLPEEMPEGPFDTILCAEILYYWSADLVREGLRRIEAALEPGGTLLFVSWRHGDPRRELNGDDVDAIVTAESRLVSDARLVTDDFILDRRVAPR